MSVNITYLNIRNFNCKTSSSDINQFIRSENLSLFSISISPDPEQTIPSKQITSTTTATMTLNSKPEFVIVPGAWHGPESFDPTSALLEKAGYAVHGVQLPCFGAQPPLENFDPDVAAIRDVVNKVLSAGRDVVLIMHSYGGVVGCEALSEYVQEAGKGGKEGWGRVRRLVFVSAFVMAEGGSLMAGLGGNNLPWFEVEVCFSPSRPQTSHRDARRGTGKERKGKERKGKEKKRKKEKKRDIEDQTDG